MIKHLKINVKKVEDPDTKRITMKVHFKNVLEALVSAAFDRAYIK